jgi:hypothetical protein
MPFTLFYVVKSRFALVQPDAIFGNNNVAIEELTRLNDPEIVQNQQSP